MQFLVYPVYNLTLQVVVFLWKHFEIEVFHVTSKETALSYHNLIIIDKA